MRMTNYTPGFIASVDQATRICRVRIPGVTDGGDVFPEAMLCYPLGDKSEHTEIRLLPGDRVWLDFVNGDPRFPIITGFRPKETDNALNWRRWHHANIELQADTDMKLLATAGKIEATAGGQVLVTAGTSIVIEAGGTVTIRGASIVLDGPTTCNSTLTVLGLLTYSAGMAGSGGGAGAGANITGNVILTGGDVTADGIGLKAHHHVAPVGGNTGPAVA